MNREKGFTIVELLVVVAIVFLMVGMVMLNLDTANKKSRDHDRRIALEELKLALDRFFYDQAEYPVSATEQDISIVLQDALVPKYMKKLPEDPKGEGNFIYTYEGNPLEYTLRARREYYEPKVYEVTNENEEGSSQE